MRTNYEDFVGNTIGSWTVLSLKREARQISKFSCLCVCGNQKAVNCADLIKGKSSSCGCQKKSKSEQTSLSRYGEKHPSKNKDVREKTRKTNLERYGVESTVSLEKVKKAAVEASLAKYGTENPFSSEKVQEGIKELWRSRGVENPSQSPEIQEKRKASFRERFGADNPSYSEDVLNKRRQTCLKHYGVSSFFLTEEFKLLETNKGWNVSRGEKEILEWVKSLGYQAYRTREFGQELDVYIPELKIGIEYNGLYWHSEIKKSKWDHFNKTKYFKELGIRVIQIFEHEWLRRNSQVKSYLSSVLKTNKNVYARKCELNAIDKKEAKEFLDKYHIQGSAPFHLAFGLSDESGTLALLTVSRHHRNSDKWVVNRFVSREGITVVGGLSRLSKYASLTIKEDLVSWCDLRWSEGNGYHKSGWAEEGNPSPDYFYTNGRAVISKQSRRKTVVRTPEGMTEREHAELDGLKRVWDCGKLRFVYKFT